MKTKPKLEPWMSAFEKLTGAKFVTVKAIGQDDRGETNTIETIMTELKQRRDWNNPEEVEIWFEEKLRVVKAQAIAEERERVRGKIEKQFGDFSLQNWSGEEEVYSEIDRLKTDLLSSLTS